MRKKELFSIFNKFPNLVVALSTQADGSMKIRYELKYDGEIFIHRQSFLRKYHTTNENLVSAKLAQEDSIAIVTKKDAGKFITHTDGLITADKQLYLAVTVADCLPIYLYNPIREVIGLMHAGWKGISKNIIKNTISLLEKQYGSQPKDVIVGIGPGIDICHFAVKDDVVNILSAYPNALEKRGKKTFLNLKDIATQQLLDLGVKRENIEVSPCCTYCEKNTYFSYRRDKTNPLQAMLAIIGM